MGRGTTKIDEYILDRVRNYAKKNFLTVSGFINATLQKELDKVDKEHSTSIYFTKESNKKKK